MELLSLARTFAIAIRAAITLSNHSAPFAVGKQELVEVKVPIIAWLDFLVLASILAILRRTDCSIVVSQTIRIQLLFEFEQ